MLVHVEQPVNHCIQEVAFAEIIIFISVFYFYIVSISHIILIFRHMLYSSKNIDDVQSCQLSEGNEPSSTIWNCFCWSSL